MIDGELISREIQKTRRHVSFIPTERPMQRDLKKEKRYSLMVDGLLLIYGAVAISLLFLSIVVSH
jgi:hypothetical protein